MSKTLAVFGADGATGSSIVGQAHRGGHDVIALTHSDVPQSEQLDGVTYRTADVLTDDLGPVLEDADVVLSALGVGNDPATLASPPAIYSEGTDNIIAGMRKNGQSRLIVISATFVEVKDRGPLYFAVPAMTALHRVFEQMKDMEAILAKSEDIAWTAMRPGWLMEGDLTEDYTVQADVIPADMIRTRHADLAHFMIACAENEDWVRQKPAIARKEDDDATSFSAVVDEMVG